MQGKPVIAGTRITVELILEKLAAGESVEQLLHAYPRLSERAIHAALRFAANLSGRSARDKSPGISPQARYASL